MSGMLTISFCDIFHNDECKEKFNVVDLDLVRKLRWISTSTILAVRRIVHRISKKVEDGKKPVHISINDKENVFMNELGNERFLKRFEAI